jgi:hypothetical protein
MDGTKIIKKFLLEKDSNALELSKKLNCSSANIYNKMKRNNFSLNELEEIAAAYGCELEISFKEKAGNKTPASASNCSISSQVKPKACNLSA